MRKYQQDWITAVGTDRIAGFTRVLLDGPGGTGKSSFFAALAKEEWEKRSGRVLVLANRDRLVRQTAGRIEKETGLEVAIEMAGERASLSAAIVVASVPTLGRINRLIGFADSHFTLVVPDEAHRSLSDQFQRVLNYFHYGAESLEEGWVKPEKGQYQPKAFIVGTTATPDIGKRKNLGQFYEKFAARYSYLEAVKDGWLVSPIQESIPVKIDLRKARTGTTSNGTDFKPEDLTALMIPIIEELAIQVCTRATNRKTMCFLPSVECARLMAEAIKRHGLQSVFVSGECLDIDEKTDAFASAGKGTVMCLCAIYVEGIDFPDVDCIAWFRATLSKAFYIQGIYRGTRVLPNLVNDDMTAEERRAIIAASDKPNLLILDPLFVHDRIDLCEFHDLFTDKPEVKQRMKDMAFDELEMFECAEKAERDFIKSLEKEAKKHAKKQARVLDPLAFALSVGEKKLQAYEPQEEWEKKPVSARQLMLLQRLNMDTKSIKTSGLAQKMIRILLKRADLKLANPLQLDFCHKIGMDEEQAAVITADEASALIDRYKQRAGSN